MKWWQKALLGALLIAEGGVFLIVLPVLAYTKQMRLEDYIQVGALLLSWPVAATVIVLFFARQFHEAIDVFLRNVGSMKLPGGVELQRQQPQRVEASGESASGIVPGAEEPVEEVLEEVVGLSDEERSTLQSQIANLVGWVRYWRFSYLNLFFVIGTKNVLDWIANNPNTRQVIDLIWTSTIPDPNQRNTIINVLLQNGLITDTNGQLQATEEGYDFLRFIGRRQ